MWKMPRSLNYLSVRLSLMGMLGRWRNWTSKTNPPVVSFGISHWDFKREMMMPAGRAPAVCRRSLLRSGACGVLPARCRRAASSPLNATLKHQDPFCFPGGLGAVPPGSLCPGLTPAMGWDCAGATANGALR